MRGYNVGLLSGDLEMDGANQSGFEAAAGRGVPQVPPALTPEAAAALIKKMSKDMTGTAKVKRRQREKKSRTGPRDPDYGGHRSINNRLVISVRKRSGIRGRGAVGSRIAVALTESRGVAELVIGSFVSNSESYLNTDAGIAYGKLETPFLDQRMVVHSNELVGPNGENNNLAEEYNFRYDRAEKGIYLNIEPKYVLDYAFEIAFRSDTRRLANGMQLRIALNVALSVGISRFWRGFTHGKHRREEFLRPHPRPAPSRGPAKGRHPISSTNGRPPR